MKKFLLLHAFIPLLALILLSLLIIVGDSDRLLADYFYHLQGDTWAWKNTWLAEQFFHKGGRNLSILMALTTLGLVIFSCISQTLSTYKKSFFYVFLAAAGGSLLVSVLKVSLAVSCPWEFSLYGGSMEYNSVFTQLGLRNGAGCFPAGHASAGFAWIAWYFFGLHYHSTWRWFGLGVPLAVGLVFGFVQQIRGAHFISHDLWSLAICWFFSLVLYVIFFKLSVKPLIHKELICS